MLGRILQRVTRKIRMLREPCPELVLPLRRPLRLPPGVSEAELRAFLASVGPAGAPAEEMARYCREDFERFVLTLNLALDGTQPGQRCLELGANPYFTTMLLHRFSKFELTLANYFGPETASGMVGQEVQFTNTSTSPHPQPLSPEGRRECTRAPHPQPLSLRARGACTETPHPQPFSPGGRGELKGIVWPTHHFNMEREAFPFADGAFDVVLFCEILEHLQDDPLRPLVEIGRVLRRGGVLILTTPNVARLENVARLLAGENIYDPYSGYGPYGRHNREYTLAELRRLLEHAGFTILEAFSADVRDNMTNAYFPVSKLLPLLGRREDLGQYLFVKARNEGNAEKRKPAWLYRSYPAEEMA